MYNGDYNLQFMWQYLLMFKSKSVNGKEFYELLSSYYYVYNIIVLVYK